MDIYKKINVGMVIGFVILGSVSFWYLKDVCTLARCHNGAYAVVFQTISIAFVIHGIVFLMLPQGYFKAWLKTVLSWALPLSIVIALQPLLLGTLFRFNMMDAVELMTYFVSVTSVAFIVIRFAWLYINAKKQKNTSSALSR